jgi:hypothetical protein
MRCKTSNGETWTTVRVREMRERLGIAEYDPAKADNQMISLMKAAEQLGICVGSGGLGGKLKTSSSSDSCRIRGLGTCAFSA